MKIKKSLQIFFLLFIITTSFVFLFLKENAFATSATITKESRKTTFSFGGKVISTTIPGVVCTGVVGVGPIMLSSNIGGAVDATTSQFSSSKGQRVVGGVTGVYKAIPFFATDLKKQPKIGNFILGKADIAPNLSICKTTTTPPIPVPVRITSYYGVSGL